MAATLATPNQRLATSVSRKIVSFIGACFVLSGATALIYEVVWARMLGLVFGATTIAISAVLAAFMGGLALGSALASKTARRFSRPLRAYALIEISIGFYALLVPALFRLTDKSNAEIWQLLHPGFYSFAFIRFVLAAIVLLFPTTLMGATLPIIVAAVRQFRDYRASTIAKLYSLNLTGAIGGAVIAGFVLLPALGILVTTRLAALTNLLLGIGVLGFASRRPHHIKAIHIDPSVEPNTLATDREQRVFWLTCAFFSGVVTISMQVVWSRLLTMIIGSSTYAFTIVLALFLIGLTIGAWIVSARVRTDAAGLRRPVMFVQLATAGTLFLSIWATNLIPSLLINFAFRFGVNSWSGLLSLQVFAAAALILVPAILMGTVMPLVLSWAGQAAKHTSEERVAGLVGQSYALNTVGAIAGAVLVAFLFIPVAGTRLTAFWIAAICLTIGGVAYIPGPKLRDPTLVRSLSVGATVLLIILAFAVWPRMNLNVLSAGAYDSYVRVLAKSRSGVPDENENDRPSDHQLLMYQEGRTATVSVRRDWGITSVAINGRTNASDQDDMPTQVMLGQLGLLVAPRINDALIIGFATGVTAGSMLQSSIANVECVEIEPAAIASSRYFEHVNNHPLGDSRLHVVIDDARTYLRVNPSTYDVIISEPSHPWVPGVANLFTREFFSLGGNRLRDDGVFVQWLQMYQLSNESLRSILATFHEVFPHVAVFRIDGAARGKDLILIGSRAPIDLNRIDSRLIGGPAAADLKRIELSTADQIREWFVCDETRLGPALRGAIINTDDNMQVETVAPRQAFNPTTEQNGAWIESLRRPVR